MTHATPRMRFWTGLVLAGCCLVSASMAHAKDLPPVGKRVYIVNEAKKFAPGVIKGQAPDRPATVLRDPLTGPPPAAKPRPAPVKAAATRPASDRSRLKLRTFSVAGKLSRPRVAFDREDVPVRPVEEPLEYDYLGKVIEEVSQEALIR